jgi:hypothetical protein
MFHKIRPAAQQSEDEMDSDCGFCGIAVDISY